MKTWFIAPSHGDIHVSFVKFSRKGGKNKFGIFKVYGEIIGETST